MELDRTLLQQLISAYKQEFTGSHWWNDEEYKWRAARHFQRHWNPAADDFPAMLKEALSQTGNLLTYWRYYPATMIWEFAQLDADKVRSMFAELFDESTDLCDRILKFQSGSAELLRRSGKEGSARHCQDATAITTYLWLRYPDHYYIYRARVVQKLAKRLNAEAECPIISSAPQFRDNLRHAFALYDALREALAAETELVQTLRNRLTDDDDPDTELHTMTCDLAHFASRPRPESEDDPQRGDRRAVGTQPRNYWWLNANPDQWSFSDIGIGGEVEYTLYNSSGHRRRIFQNFIDAKVGDPVIGYESTPVRQVVALCTVSQPSDGARIRFRKEQQLAVPLDIARLREAPELQSMEFFHQSRATLLKLSPAEYEFLLELIQDDPDAAAPAVERVFYGREDFLREVYLGPEHYDAMKRVLKAKKNIILQGPPGVGKTFLAERLAFSMIGEKDAERVEFVQFHQNYSYEDFVMGYKPDGEGFRLTPGIFYSFCKKAAADPDRDFFFIIDEINRGNMSKIFGELLMLIEKDYRGRTIRLSCGGLPFAVPANLHMIGMMNTADRSLAMIDYALRRRFSFFEIAPAFDSAGFTAYREGLHSPAFDRLVAEIKELNRCIEEDSSLGRGFRIGHSYLCGATEASDEWLRSVVEFDILPMLAEYWFDEPEKYDQWSRRLGNALR